MDKFNKIFEDFIKLKENSLFIINTKNQDKYSEFIKKSEYNYFLFDAFNEKIGNPYFPFLNCIREKSEKLTEVLKEELIENSKIYYFQKEIFKGFLLNKEIKRNEELNIEEIKYEKSEMNNSLKNIMNYSFCNEKETIIFIKNGNFLEESSLNFIKWILGKNIRERFIIVLNFDDTLFNADEDLAAIWEEILEIGEERALIYNSEEIYEEKRRDNRKRILKKISGEIKEQICYAKECYNFLAFEECKKIVLSLKQKVETDNINEEEKIQIYNLAGNNFLMLKESDQALWFYNFTAEYGLDNNNKNILCKVYRKMAAAHGIKQNFEMAEKYAEKSLKIAIEIGNELNILKSYYTIFLIKSNISSKELGKIKHIFEKIEEFAEKYKMYNMLTRCYGIAVAEYEFYKDNNRRFEVCTKALKIAIKYENKNRIASLYHNLAYIYMGLGYKEKSFEYYKKSERLKIKLGIKNEIAKIYNGIGYDFLIEGKFKEAFFNFEKAFEYLTDEREYGEILLTFYNIAVMYFLMGIYEKVTEYLKNILYIMKILNMKKIQFHSLTSIYSLLAIAAIKQKKYMKSIEYYNNAKVEKELYSEEENIYLNIMNALILNEEKNYKYAVEEFKKIKEIKSKVSSKILTAKYYFEYEMFLKENKKNKELEEVKKEREKFCKENWILNYENIFGVKLDKKEEKFFLGKEFNIKSISEFAKQEININTIHKKRAEEKFLIKVQQMFLKKGKEKGKIIEELVTLIKNNFIVEECIFFLINTNGNREKYSYDVTEEEDKIAEFISEYEKTNRTVLFSQDKCIEVEEKYGIKYNSIILVPMKIDENLNGVFMFATKNQGLVFNEEEERVLSIITQQFSIVMLNMELTKTLENKNKILLNALEKVKSMENMVSIIHTEKDKQMGINYILNILVTEYSFKCKKVFYLNYNEQEKALFVNGSSEYEENIKEALNSIKIKIEDKNEISKAFSSGEKKEGESDSGIISYIFGIKRFAIIPVSYQDRKYGVLLVEKAESKNEEIEVNEDILNMAAVNLAVYLENKKFHKEILKSEKLKAVVEFSRAIVHELRTPLSGIKGFAKIEKRRHMNDEKTEKHMNEIINGAEKIDEMAGELLYYVSDESVNLEKISVKKVVNTVLKEMNTYILSENIEVMTAVSEEILISFEKEQLKKIIREIIKNSIEAAADDLPKIWISAEEKENSVDIFIRDNGIGMDFKELKLIGEPLNSSKIQGKGMGIPIVKSILKRHNSEIKIESVKGEWTEVKITIYNEGKENEYNSF